MGRRTHCAIASLGEKVLYMPQRKKGGRLEKLDARFRFGIWVGIVPSSSESLIATPMGVVTARTIRRLPEDERWDGEFIKRIKGTPWDPKGAGPEHEIQVGQPAEAAEAAGQAPAPDVPPDVPPEPVVQAPRRFQIRKADIAAHGYTDGCQGCRAIRLQLPQQGHSEACAARLYPLMMESGDRRKYLEKKEAEARKAKDILERERRSKEEQRRTRKEETDDYWVNQGDEWIRHHICPRQALFTPAGTTGGPKVSTLLSERVTVIEGQAEPITDNWQDQADAHRVLPGVRWVGKTIFRVQHSARPASRAPATRGGSSASSKPSGSSHEPTPAAADDDDLAQRPAKLARTSRQGQVEPQTGRQGTLKAGRATAVRVETPRGRADEGDPAPKKARVERITSHPEPEPDAEDEEVDWEEWAAAIETDRKRAEERDEEYEPQAKRSRTDLNVLDFPMAGKDLLREEMVTEIYSAPKVVPRAAEIGFQPGWSVDKEVTDEEGRSWDLNVPFNRLRLARHVRDQKPKFLIGSPACKPFSNADELEEGIDHMGYACALYSKQAKSGRYFIHEQPATASSWDLPCVQRVAAMKGVQVVRFDQCMFGLTTPNGGKAKKPMRVMTNSPAVAEALSVRCDGSHEHEHSVKGLARCAQGYPRKLVEIMCDAMAMQVFLDKHSPDLRNKEPICEVNQAQFVDSISGEALDTNMVQAARQEEIEFVRRMHLYDKIPIQECWEYTGRKPVGVRWVDVNKGTPEMPNYRSRVVAKEIKLYEQHEFFSATPPLEALKVLLSSAARRDRRKVRVMHIDVRRAYFHAPVKRRVYAALPPEDCLPGEEHLCGRLRMSMYGTRDAARNWEERYTQVLLDNGFEQGKVCPCAFVHPSRAIQVTVHGDDFTAVCDDEGVAWLKNILGAHFEVKVNVLGLGKGCTGEITVLNRKITINQDGIWYQADGKHVKTLLRELGLEDAKGVATTGPVEGKIENADLTGEEAHRFRQLAARCNYLAQDRADAQFAIKELCRAMSSPGSADWAKLKRVARYLKEFPRLRLKFAWQEEGMSKLIGFSDSDWAGEPAPSRKSTSGGVIMWGPHTLKSWSKTQRLLALSSGEAELYAAVKCTSELIGIRSLLRDLKMDVPMELRVDAKATLGMIARRGTGGVKHIEAGQLWIQDWVRRKELGVRKVHTDENPADLFTKYLDSRKVVRHVNRIGGRFG